MSVLIWRQKLHLIAGTPPKKVVTESYLEVSKFLAQDKCLLEVLQPEDKRNKSMSICTLESVQFFSVKDILQAPHTNKSAATVRRGMHKQDLLHDSHTLTRQQLTGKRTAHTHIYTHTPEIL